jgi:hypothetical protein
MSDLDVLNAIERLELRALRWGFAEGSLSVDEAEAMAAEILPPGSDPADAIDRLQRRQLLVDVLDAAGHPRLRSRFAETVRLLSHLRQQFVGRPWVSSPRLVSDYRVDIRLRRYARRNRLAADVLQQLGAGASPLREKLWAALTGAEVSLADFQEEAAARLLRPRPDTGLIVTAGTGSGKTLAFYLPGLIRIAEETRAGEAWTKALAVYPRTELLKDQLGEAFRMARRLDPHLGAPRRPLRLGAYFGSTPNRARAEDVAQRGWRRRFNDFVCPWMPCPSCGGDLLWRQQDLNAGREELHCGSPSCQSVVGEAEITLTRDRLQREPPDLLFTTTEMLNQRLSDISARRLFGVGQGAGRRPIFALLDEVHTYTGVPGAQAALTLRRWRHALGAPVTYVGLSATLREAPRFFADLVGLDPAQVEEATPRNFVEEGAEYQILLRGDPASQTSLLSTSIQSLMILTRMLDPMTGGASGEVFGSRVFAFTDNLDVINRLFDSLRDAEGLDIFGRPQRPPLAALRVRPADPVERLRRDRDGQIWRAVERIGRSLTAPLSIGRTSSEDAGVLADADVVVATAALEVGYNDRRVGAVLQHKAPRDAASFLQRRGRAGRVREMRPITITVLSDYGRDRLAFEAYEHLFDPELPPQRLPVENDYVLRMQATYALFDWLAASSQAPWGWAWEALSRPPADGQAGAPLRVFAKQRLLQLIEGHEPTLRSLMDHLARALKIDPETVENLLWSPPRALLLEAVPTLARRLHRDWRPAFPAGPQHRDFQVDWHPLPDFVARTLFTDLSLPEVAVVLPAATVRDEEKVRTMAIAQALGELAPGRVTRRYATEHGALHHWSPVDPDSPEQDIEIGQYAEISEAVGDVETAKGRVAVYRPWRVRLEHARRAVAGPTSNAWLFWDSRFAPVGDSAELDLGGRNPWRDYIPRIGAYLHSLRSHVAVRRFASDGEAVVRRLQGDRRVCYRFVDRDGAPAAVGFEIDVDALAVDLDLAQAMARIGDLAPELLAGCRLGYLRHRLVADPELPEEINLFQRDWLHQTFISAALVRAVADNLDLATAAMSVLDGPTATERLTEALNAIFQGQGVSDDPDQPDDEGDGADDTAEDAHPTGRDGAASAQGQSVLSLLHDATVRDRLRALASELTAPDPAALHAWIEETLVATLGEAVLQAVCSVVPRHISADSLTVDIDTSETTRVWVCETTLGGAGVLQAVFARVADEPRTFFTALEATLAPTDLELAAEGLEAFVRLATSNPDVAQAVQRLRVSASYDEREDARVALYAHLSDCGLDVGRALSVSLNARVLTPTSSAAFDVLLVELLDRWRELERRLGVSLGVRQMAFVFASDAAIRARVQLATGLPQVFDQAEAAHILANLLWPRGVEISQRALQSYNRFAPRRATDPRLTRALLQRSGHRVSLEDPNWGAALTKALALHGTVELCAQLSHAERLRQAILEALATPLDVGYLQFFPKLDRTERRADGLIATLVVQEQV